MESILQAMESRHNYRFFRIDKIPSKEKIEKILNNTTKYIPVKGASYYFEIEVFGPEYYEEKKKFVLQCCCQDWAVPLYDPEVGTRQEHIRKDLTPHLERYLKQKHRMQKCDEQMRFNAQVLAPYLLKYKYKKTEDGKVPPIYCKQVWETTPRDEVRMMQGAAMHGMGITLCAQEEGIDASYCGCYIDSKYNPNKIYNSRTKDDNVAFFICLGYADLEAEKHNPIFAGKDKRPHWSKIVNWKND